MTDKKRDLEKTRQKLIEAASLLMNGCNEPDEVTSRAIAKESGVNVAMINYCFGSREGLLFEVFRKMLEDALTRFPELSHTVTSSLDPKECVTELHYLMMKLMIANYTYSKAITRFILLNRNIDFGMESLPYIKAYFSDKKTDEQCRLIAFELSSIHELSVLRYAELKEEFGIDLTDDNTLKEFVLENVERFLD